MSAAGRAIRFGRVHTATRILTARTPQRSAHSRSAPPKRGRRMIYIPSMGLLSDCVAGVGHMASSGQTIPRGPHE